MKKLDWYIILKHQGAFFFTAILFTIIAIAIDYSEKISKILEHNLGFWEVLQTRYFVYIPYINGELWPLFALISIIFVSSRLAQNNEVISMLGTGMSFWRYMRPWLISAMFLSIIFAIGRHIIIPQSNKVYRYYEAKYYWEREQKVLKKDIHFFVSEDTKVFVDRFQKRDTSVYGLRIEKFKEDTLVTLIKAKKGKWLSGSGKWRLENIEERMTYEGNERLKERIEERDTTLRMQPEDFIQYSSQREMMTTSQLKKYIETEKKKGVGANRMNYIELYRRSSEPFTMILLTVMGVCIASRKKRGGIGLNLAIGVSVGALYIVFSKFSHTFATNAAMSPWLGVWLPNLIFVFICLWLYLKAQK